MSILRATGLIKRPEETRARFAAERRYVPLAAPTHTVLQPVARILDQLSKPACVGYAVAGRRDSLVPDAPRMSPVKAWILARWNDGTLEDPNTGTWAESVFDALIDVGPMQYVPGEESQSTELDTVRPSVTDEITADSARIAEDWEHHQISGNVVAQAIDALDRGMLVPFGDGLRDPFFGLRADEVATSKHFGGNSNGHEQGIVGFHAGRGLFIGQNSWGEFAGITLPGDVSDDEIRAKFPCARGRFLPGCFWFDPEVLELAWDVDVLRVK